MMGSDNPPRNKILIVGRRGVGKLSLVQSILGSRFVPTTSVSKSRPSSPLILPAIPVPTIEDSILDNYGGGLSQTNSTTTPPNITTANLNLADNPFESTTSPTSPLSQRQRQLQLEKNPNGLAELEFHASQSRPKLDHSGVTIPWTIDTKYYSVQVDFWIDETEEKGKAELERMIQAGELDEMGAVVEAVVFCFSKNQPSTFYDIKPWLSFVERLEPSITLCVATGAPIPTASELDMQDLSISNETITDYDDWCLGNGFEFIDLNAKPEDADQDEHVGLDRIMEALAAHMWDGLKRKSSKKRDQHDRSMMMSFRDDDGDMAMDSSWRANISRRSIISLDGGDINRLRDFGGLNVDEEDEDEDDDEEDEDDDRAFSRALQELNLHNRMASPTAPARGPIFQHSADGQIGINEEYDNSGQGFDDDFGDFVEADSGMDDINKVLERRFRQYLEQPLDDTTATSSDNGGRDTSGEMDSSDKDFPFELNDDGEIEFGSFRVSAGPGGDDLEDFDIALDDGDGLASLNRESIRSMHKALFSNIDDDDGMAQTIATLQGLREQGKGMSEKDRRELAARVALSFGMQME